MQNIHWKAAAFRFYEQQNLFKAFIIWTLYLDDLFIYTSQHSDFQLQKFYFMVISIIIGWIFQHNHQFIKEMLKTKLKVLILLAKLLKNLLKGLKTYGFFGINHFQIINMSQKMYRNASDLPFPALKFTVNINSMLKYKQLKTYKSANVE